MKENLEQEKIKQLAKKYRINTEKINYILNKFGTMESFLEANRKGKLDQQDLEVLKSNLRTYIDISNSDNEIMKSIFEDVRRGNNTINEEEFFFIDLNVFQNKLDTLDDREKEILLLRYSKEKHTLGEIGNQMGIGSERVRQIEAKGLRKLVHPCRMGPASLRNVECYLKGEDAEEGEKLKYSSILERIFNSNAIFLPDQEYSNEPSDISEEEYEEIYSYFKELSVKLEKIEKKKTDEYVFESLPLFIRRIFEPIGIESIRDLEKFSKKELKGLGVPSEEIDKLEKHNKIIFKEDDNEEELGMKSSLFALNFTKRANQLLFYRNIRTVEDLLNTSEEELQDLLYDKRGRRGKAGYDTMKEVLKRRSELSETLKSTELEMLKSKKEELTVQSKGLEEQTKDAKELLESYEKLAKGTTQADDNSNPDFKD